MATIIQGQKDDKDNKAAPDAPLSMSGASTATITPGGTQGTPARKQQGSGRFTNLQQYMQANKGAGERLAGKIGENVAGQTQKLGQQVEAAKGVQSQLDAEKQRIAQASGLSQQVAQDPTKVDVNQFRQLYTGQTGLQPIQQQAQQSFDTAQSQLGNVQNLANLTGTESGRFELLRQSLNRPTYTRGQQRLDQLMIQGGGGDILGQLQRDTAAQARAGEQLLGTTRSDIESQLSGLGTQAQEAQKQLQSALGTFDDPTTQENEAAGAMGSLQTRLNQEAAARQKLLEDQYSRIRSGLQKGEISKEDAALLGLDKLVVSAQGAKPLTQGQTTKLGSSGQQLLIGDLTSEDLLSRLQKGFDTVTASGVANQQDYDRLQALKQLADIKGPAALELDQSKLGKAGQAAAMNAEQLQKDIQARINTLQKQYEGQTLDPLAAYRLAGGAERRLLEPDLQLSDKALLDKYKPGVSGSADKAFVANQAAKVRQDLQNKIAQASTKENWYQTIDPSISGYYSGLTYGQLSDPAAVANFLKGTGANQNQLLNTLTPEQVANFLKDTTLGGGINIAKRQQDAYEKLGLNKTLKIT